MAPTAAGTAVTSTAPDPTPAQRRSAEVVGTHRTSPGRGDRRQGRARSTRPFVLVFFGVGSALSTGADVVTTGLAFTLTVLVMACSVGRVSGGHFNPAVSVGAAASGRLAWSQLPAYVGAQLVGAIVAPAVLWSIWQGRGRDVAEAGRRRFGRPGWVVASSRYVGEAALLRTCSP